MDWPSFLTQAADVFGIVSFLLESTTTERVFLLLASKPLFIAVALWVGFWSGRARLPDDDCDRITSRL